MGVVICKRGLADIWKKNIMKNLENEELEYITVGEFLMDLKKSLKEEIIR